VETGSYGGPTILCFDVLLGQPSLGGHLKTGHTWTPQNRPTDASKDKSIHTVPWAVWASCFSPTGQSGYTDDTWAKDSATKTIALENYGASPVVLKNVRRRIN
jgi:hypothetical protein